MQTTDVVVIGGGITGLGVARDAAMRGFKVTLIEQNELGSGTSGYFHELLHSGARYVTNDPISATECYSENQILRKIAGDAVTDTGGLFLAITPDDLAFSDHFLDSCKTVGIPVEEIDLPIVLNEEPRLNSKLQRAFSVSDGRVDGEKLLRDTKLSAEKLGVSFHTHHEVIGFVKQNNLIQAVTVLDKNAGEQKQIETSYVVNASGIWAGKVGKLAGVPINLLADKGVMVVFDDKPSEKVLNRCRKPSNGDILVPTDTQSIWGTTSSQTEDIETHEAIQVEIDELLREADILIPNLSLSKMVRVFAAVRPLYSASMDISDGRKVSRSFQVINHKTDGVDNFLSVVGGKFTIHRLMAEKAVDEVCRELDVDKKCQTAEIPFQ